MLNSNSKILKEYHEKLNLIFDEQDKLPHSGGKKDNTEIVTKIEYMAHNLMMELLVFKEKMGREEESDISEIDNIIIGCEKLRENPYKRFGGRISIE